MKKEEFFIYGKHAVFAALNNPERKIDEIMCLEDNTELRKSIQKVLSENNKKIKLKYVSNRTIESMIKKNLKHQGLLAKSYKLEIENYVSIFDKKSSFKNNLKYGVILDRLTDPNNIGAIYRSAKAFGLNFIINTDRHSVIENSTILNSACGAFDTIKTFITNNISTAIKNFISEGWWVIALDHKANSNLDVVINKMTTSDKIIFVFGSEGRGIRRLIKENCNFTVYIPNIANTQSIN
ncbi:RNA methyltransferase, partial [Alphaproteobacteria bacterium]|nr:RNA methyltransferase [Alphaproteobacteria bacterium]